MLKHTRRTLASTRPFSVGLVAMALVLALGAGLGAATNGAAAGVGQEPKASGAVALAATVKQPNIVFFLTDDMSTKHLRHMPSTRNLIFRTGARFSNFGINVSLCCPARASLLTGKYAHNTGITGNEYPDGFYGFHHGDEADSTFPIALRRAGYRTSLLGKYLNDYPFVRSAPEPGMGVSPRFVPPGWSRWAVPIRGQYAGRKYDINLDGRIRHKEGARNYLGDFLMRRAVRQVRANRDGRGLAMMFSFYGPHRPEPASPIERTNDRLKARISRISYPRTPDFNERDVSDKPSWVRSYPRLDRRDRAVIDGKFRRQVMSVASIDRHVRVVVRALRRTGQLDNTYLVFTSDHGLHMGSHRLPIGKNTAYRDDVNVPFAISGPGIPAGRVVREPVSVVDVAPTFADMAGIPLSWVPDGESALPLAQGRQVPWRDWLFIQRGKQFQEESDSHDEPMARSELRAESLKPGYRGVVGRRWAYVDYANGEEELYDLQADPYQLANLMAPGVVLTEEQQAVLEDARAALVDLKGCVGMVACRR